MPKEKFLPLLVCFCFVAFFSLSCQRPTARDQAVGQLPIPEFYNGSKGVFLLEDNAPRNFNGWFIIWDPEISSSALAEVLAANNNYNQINVKRLGFFADNINPLTDEIKILEKELSAANQEKTRGARSSRLSAAATWWETASANALLQWDSDDQAAANAAFSHYCEAKIWEATLSKEFVKTRYQSRPSPLVLCEDYYRSAGLLLETDPACASAPIGESKSFFSCYWQQGVLKTRHFAHIVDRERVAAIGEDVLVTYISGPLFSPAILKQQKVRIDGTSYDFSFPGQVSPGDVHASWDTASVQIILQSFVADSLNQITADGLRLISLAKPRSTEALAATESLRADLAFFAKRVNEKEFNDPLKMPLPPTSSESVCLQGSAEWQAHSICAVLAAVDAGLDEKISNLTDEIYNLENTRSQRLKEVGKNCDEDPASLSCDLRKAADAREIAIGKEGIALAVLPQNRFALEIRRDEKEVIKAKIAFDIEKAAPIPMTVDDSESALSISLQIDDPKLLGFVQRPKVESLDFNLLSEKQLKGLRLDLKLYPNRWDDLVDILSGELTFSSGDTPRFYGAAILEDQNATELGIRR